MAPVPPSPKHLWTEGNSDNTSNPTAQTQTVPAPSIERPLEKWWLYFREFEGAEDAEVTSIFDRRFPMVDVIEGNLCKAADRARIQRAGLRNTASIAQSMAAETSFLAHGLGHESDGENNLSQVRDLEGDADSLSRMEKIIKPSPRLGRRCRLPESDGENNLSQVRDLEGDADSQSRMEKIM
ncbi:methyl-accepting chemotaxis protein [Sesbania bispinosa]|nr:methyl-accepting chemotaxis protein [Sesbania bispinosa]